MIWKNIVVVGSKYCEQSEINSRGILVITSDRALDAIVKLENTFCKFILLANNLPSDNMPSLLRRLAVLYVFNLKVIPTGTRTFVRLKY